MNVNQHLIKREREKRAWTQEHLASATGLGLRTIQRIESSGAGSAESALALAAVFELPVEEIATSTGDETSADDKRLRARVGYMLVACLAIIGFMLSHYLVGTQDIGLEVGAHVNGDQKTTRKVLVKSGDTTTLFFEQLELQVTPEKHETDKLVRMNVRFFEHGPVEKKEIFVIPELVHEMGEETAVRLGDLPSGNSYRFTLRPFHS